MSRSIRERIVRWAALMLLTPTFAVIAPAVSQSASCLVEVGRYQDAGSVYRFHTASDGTLLVGTDKGLFRRDGDKLVPIGKDQDTGSVRTFHTASDGTLVVAPE